MQTTTLVPRELQEKVDGELEPGERVVWIDMPVPRFFTQKASSFFVFAIGWNAFFIWWIVTTPEVLLKGGAVPFLLAGLAMLTAPLWAYRQAFRTVYVVTDRRAILFHGLRSTTVRSFPPDQLRGVFRREGRDGTGDVILAKEGWQGSEGYHSEDVGFLGIRNPREVETLIKALAKQA